MDDESSSSSSSSSSLSRRSRKKILIVTPDVKSERRKRRLRKLRESERKKEKAIVAHLLKHRHCDEDSFDEADPVRIKLFAEEENSNDLASIDETTKWAKTLPAEVDFLTACVGSDAKHRDRLTSWSRWASQVVVVPTVEDNAALWIRTIMKCLCSPALPFADLKRILLQSNGENFLSTIFATAFGGFKRTLLHAVCMHVHVDMILPLMRQIPVGPTIKADKFGLTPLHLLVLNPHCLKAHSLDFFRSQISVPEPSANALPLHLFLLSDHSKMAEEELEMSVKKLAEKSSGCFSENRKSVHLARTVSAARAVVKYCGKGALILDNEGFTPLHIACAEGLPRLVEFWFTQMDPLRLVRCTESGRTALHVAAAGGSEAHAECIEILAAKMPSSQIVATLKDNQGWPPLLYALFGGTTATVRACLALDKQLRDPTWGESPQLIFALQLARKENSRRTGSWEGQGLSSGRIEQLLIVLLSVPEFFNFLNEFLAKDIARLAGPLSFILELPNGPQLLSLENKLLFLNYRALSASRRCAAATHALLVFRPREHRTRDWLLQVLHKLNSSLGQSVSVRFLLPDGILPEPGYGIGPTREFFSICQEMICNEVFTGNDENSSQLLPSDEPRMDMAHRCLGRVVALALLSGGLDLSRVSPILWKYLLGTEKFDMDSLESWDPALARSLRWLLLNEVDENVRVAMEGETSVEKFVQKKIRKSLAKCNLVHFKDGFFDVFQETSWIVNVFDSQELAVIFGSDGRAEIDLIDWKKNTRYSPAGSEDRRIEWFWDFVQLLPNKERQLLLLFVTGLSVPPMGGFTQMKSYGGEPMLFTIMLLPDRAAELPTAATCFNMLRLPAYPTREILNQKLLTAIRFGSQGFLFS